jgi:hypothetical protein
VAFLSSAWWTPQNNVHRDPSCEKDPACRAFSH